MEAPVRATGRQGSTIPEATVPEFERKVNELMLVSLSLTGRPKRRKSGVTTRRAKGAWTRWKRKQPRRAGGVGGVGVGGDGGDGPSCLHRNPAY